MTTNDRRGAADARRGTTDLALDLANKVDVLGLFGLGGGLLSLGLFVEAVRGGDGDGDDAGLGPWARRLIDDDQRPPGNGISCADRKDGNWFTMSACALGYAYTSVERNLVRVVREDSSYVSAPVLAAVMSVFVKSVYN